jgi:pyruvate ferredoxin oxidoreductase alpha subunit/phenylglyoxylate dehydrogenase alpha subunit
MSIVTRDGITPQCVWGGQQDAMTVREAGWLHMYCETVQEVADTVIMAYKIAEHRDVMLPVNVNHDGNYLSYGVDRVELPDQEDVDAFLGEKNLNWHVALDPERPMAVDPLTGGAGGEGPALFTRYRKGSCKAMQNALKVITDVHEEWGERFGRRHAPLIEEYRLDDADYAIVTIGGMTGAGKDAVDLARDSGENAGLIKIKTMRPFPFEKLRQALSKVQAVGVVDRSVSFGWNCGPVYQELLSALYFLDRKIPAISFIGGLAGADITIEHFSRAIEETGKAFRGVDVSWPIWLNEDD